MQFREAMQRVLSADVAGESRDSATRDRIVRTFFGERPTAPAVIYRLPLKRG
jgi:hypothetical protein